MFLWNLWLWATTAVTASTFELLPTLTYFSSSEQVGSGIGLLLLLFLLVLVLLFWFPAPLPRSLSFAHRRSPLLSTISLDASTVSFAYGIRRACSTLA